MLINIAGKQRMLSHRFALYTTLANTASDASARQRCIDVAEQTIAELRQNQTSLVEGDGANIPAGVSESAKALLASRQSLVVKDIERFFDEANDLFVMVSADTNVAPERMKVFAGFVSTDLVKSLNEVIAAINTDLNKSLDDQRARTKESREVMSQALNKISRTGAAIKMISLNPTIEAARAGEQGAAFAVVAHEVRQLSNETGRIVAGMEEQLESMFHD